MKAWIEQTRCIACGLCREICPDHAIHPKFQDVHHRFEVLPADCTGCGLCLEYCPAPGALVQYEEVPPSSHPA